MRTSVIVVFSFLVQIGSWSLEARLNHVDGALFTGLLLGVASGILNLSSMTVLAIYEVRPYSFRNLRPAVTRASLALSALTMCVTVPLFLLIQNRRNAEPRGMVFLFYLPTFLYLFWRAARNLTKHPVT